MYYLNESINLIGISFKKIFLNCCSVYILEFLSKNLFINIQILFYWEIGI